MNDPFRDKTLSPMLIGEEGEAFDSEDYLYELKLDGERCIAYLDVDGTELRNKRNVRMLPKLPELFSLHRQVNCRCVLDGELTVMKDGKPDFSEIQRRSLMTHPRKIEMASMQFPACFVAFDIVYHKDRYVTNLPLSERKCLLDQVVQAESPRFAVTRMVERRGKAFFQLAQQQNLEGIVAKRKDSRYYFGKRTKDWIKSKNMLDDDFVVCGYLPKEQNITSIILGQYEKDNLSYKGHVTLGVGGSSFQQILSLERLPGPPFAVPSGHQDAVWLIPQLVCTVKYLSRTDQGGMRHPVFKGLRDDKSPEECIAHSSDQ